MILINKNYPNLDDISEHIRNRNKITKKTSATINFFNVQTKYPTKIIQTFIDIKLISSN